MNNYIVNILHVTYCLNNYIVNCLYVTYCSNIYVVNILYLTYLLKICIVIFLYPHYCEPIVKVVIPVKMIIQRFCNRLNNMYFNFRKKDRLEWLRYGSVWVSSVGCPTCCGCPTGSCFTVCGAVLAETREAMKPTVPSVGFKNVAG